MSDAAARRRGGAAGVLSGLVRAREFGLVIAIGAVLLLLVSLGKTQVFFGAGNLESVLRQIALLGVFSLGEAVVIIAGGIDLSVGSLICFSGMGCALLLSHLAGDLDQTVPVPAWMVLTTLLATVALGALVGGFHTLLITRLRLPPFIATLSTLAGLRSGAELVTNSATVSVPYPNFTALAKGLTPLWFFIAAAVCVAVLMRATVTGRQIVALGGNEEAARLSGLKVNRLKLVAYGLSGALAGLGGVLYTAYLGQGDPRTGQAFELQAIAASVVGGCSLSGGQGTVAGTILGVTLLQVLLNGIGLVIHSNSTLWQGVVVGVVVVMAVAMNAARQRRIAAA
ncbi:MAG: ABC transporter permease [Armatimonadetes bacterium]|nr:ABC transporter permease [Armatimonadota bacterium]